MMQIGPTTFYGMHATFADSGDRAHCAAVFCQKSTKRQSGASDLYLCADHWRLVPKPTKARLRKADREGRDGLVECLFWRAVAEAIDACAGLSADQRSSQR